jgi:hypothetical protein
LTKAPVCQPGTYPSWIPSKVGFCSGSGVGVGDGVGVDVGAGVNVGNGVTVAAGASVGPDIRVGCGVALGRGVHVGNEVDVIVVGDGTALGAASATGKDAGLRERRMTNAIAPRTTTSNSANTPTISHLVRDIVLLTGQPVTSYPGTSACPIRRPIRL